MDTVRIATLEQEKHVLNKRMSDLEREAKRSASQRRSSPRRDLGNVIRILLPDIHFLRDSLDVITQELESFEQVLHELRNLCSDPANVEGKKVESARKWKWQENTFVLVKKATAGSTLQKTAARGKCLFPSRILRSGTSII